MSSSRNIFASTPQGPPCFCSSPNCTPKRRLKKKPCFQEADEGGCSCSGYEEEAMWARLRSASELGFIRGFGFGSSDGDQQQWQQQWCSGSCR